MNNESIFHVIKDPVHGTMQFTTAENNWIKPFIDSPNFQRLRHIKQLGMGDFIFPGAVHTRFNHCIGCSYIATQISKKIGLTEESRQLVIIACLLHDIGHGPFSHAFEGIFQNNAIRHEAWTPFFLADYRNAEFFDDYNHQNPRAPLTHEKFDLIQDMIMHKALNNRVLADIVSSQLDADRLDYLLRDSHFCGVTYGQFDFRWMINSMAIVPSKHGNRLGLTHKGIGVVEHYLMARRLMTRNIYHHHKKLALEHYMVKLLVNLSEHIVEHPAYAHLCHTRLGNFLVKANMFNQESLHALNTDALKQTFLKANFAHYKELADYDVFSIIKQLSQLDDMLPASQIAQRIQYRRMPKIVRLDNLDIPVMLNELNDFKHRHRNDFQDWQIDIIKTPHQSYTIEEDPIYIENEAEKVKPLNEISLMINAISDKYENTAFLCIDKVIAEDKRVKKLIASM